MHLCRPGSHEGTALLVFFTCKILQALFLQISEYPLAGDYCHGVLAAQAAADTARQLIKALASLGSSDAKQARHHYQQPHEEKQLY